ncbi:4Fe-4S dicluster domain-containing protein [Thermodesulfobacteriota bacterium]
MKSYAMVIDVAKCNGCYSCVLACKDEHCEHDYPGYAAPQPMTGQFWLNLIEKERGTYPKVKLSYTPITCMQCKNAPCIKAAKDNAVYRRDDGIVIIDPVKASGQKQIVSACPYRVIFWNEEKDVPQKCTMCAHLLDQGWKRPRCVEMCPTGALTFGDPDELKSDISKNKASMEPYSLHPEYGLDERVLYLNVPKKFVAGIIVYKGTDECAKDATVTISGDGINKTTQTDGFGDFEFEGLAGNSDYMLKVEASGYESQEIEVRTSKDVYLGEIFLTGAHP